MINKRNGFTLIEATIAVAVASILAAIAVPQYNIYVAKTQLAESIALMDSAKPTTVASVVKNGLCTIDGKDLVVDGKYGSLVVSGTVNQTAVKNSKVRMATGCVFTYTLNTTGVSKLIAGKTVVADLFNNGTFSKNAASTAEPKLVPKALSLLDQDTAGGKLIPVVPGGPVITNPDDNGGPSTPLTPPDPVDPTNPPDPTNPTDPTNPPDPTNPTDPTNPPEDGSGNPIPEVENPASTFRNSVSLCQSKTSGRLRTADCRVYDKDKTKIIGIFSVGAYDQGSGDHISFAIGVMSYIQMNSTCPSPYTTRNEYVNACRATGYYRNCNIPVFASRSCTVDLAGVVDNRKFNGSFGLK